MTVKELWDVTTADLFVQIDGKAPAKLPTGGNLPKALGSRDILTIRVYPRASETPYLLLELKPKGGFRCGGGRCPFERVPRRCTAHDCPWRTESEEEEP